MEMIATSSLLKSCQNFGQLNANSSRSDNGLGTDLIEAKVQVDRRKLETMILAVQNENGIVKSKAEQFFESVESRTGATIFWPSQLKLKAKTKKDPFVKLIGRLENVQSATEMILSMLKIKKDRITLKMEVQHTQHSQIIGRGGRNTQDIMHETNCHIHFPDSNKHSDIAKNNQVSISGSAVDVERARARLRAIAPLVVSIGIQLNPNRNLFAMHSQLNPVELQRKLGPPTPDISLHFTPNCPLGTLHFLVKSSPRKESAIAKVVGKICEHLGIFPSGGEIVCSSNFEVRPSLLHETYGLFAMNTIQWIAYRSNTQMHFSPQGILIIGALEGIFMARKFLTGLLPVSVQFERPIGHEIDKHALRSVEIDQDVLISEKRKKTRANGQEPVENQLFILRTYEANLFGAFNARNLLLKLDEVPIPELFDDYSCMRNLIRQAGMTAFCQAPFATCPNLVKNERLVPGNPTKPSAFKKDPGTVSSQSDWPLQLEKTQASTSTTILVNEQPKSPDPNESPIAAGLLAGAKSINNEKGFSEFRKQMALNREKMLMKANQAVYTSVSMLFDEPIEFTSFVEDQTNNNTGRHPTDLWAGYGFSNSLPADNILRMGRLSRIWMDEPEEKDQKLANLGKDIGLRKLGRPIVGRGAGKSDDEEDTTGLEPAPLDSAPLDSAPFSGTSLGFGSSVKQILSSVQEEEEVDLMMGGNPLISGEFECMRPKQNDGERPKNYTATKIRPKINRVADKHIQKSMFAVSTGGLFESPNNFTWDANLENPTKNVTNQNIENEKHESTMWDIRVLREPAMVLAQLGCNEYVAVFRDQEIDMQAFLLLDEQCLKNLGVSTMGARKKIFNAILNLRISANKHGYKYM